jgi:hypothetical protein
MENDIHLLDRVAYKQRKLQCFTIGLAVSFVGAIMVFAIFQGEENRVLSKRIENLEFQISLKGEE